MRILIYPHLMEIGGSQLNAIELAHRLSERGHTVVLFAPDGALMSTVERFGLQCFQAPNGGSWPTLNNIRTLCSIVREHEIEVVHGFEWGPSLELAFGPHRRSGTPMVTTVLSMSVPDFLPTHESIVVGTGELLKLQEGVRDKAFLMEPPIDTDANAPSADIDVAHERTRLGLSIDDFVISIVSRLTTDLDKVNGVLDAISAVDNLAQHMPIKLLIAGEGPGLSEVNSAADMVNAKNDRMIVMVLGGMLDPRGAYRAADVVIGMGSSALKGMAFGKPLVVQGSNGFWRLLDCHSLPTFLEKGFYGNSGSGAHDLQLALAALYADPARRVELGAFGRETVVSRYSLTAAVTAQEEIYRRAVEERPSAAQTSSALRRTAFEFAKFKMVILAHNAKSRSNRRLRAGLCPISRRAVETEALR